MADPPFEYGRYEEGRGLNYWAMNPPLQAEAERYYPDDEFAWATPKLEEFGDLVGGTIAENADRIDANGPELRTYDAHGTLRNHVEYHPAQVENERLIFEHGIVADAFRAPDDRERPVGLLHTLTEQLLLAYADIGLACAQSMTTGAALVLRNHDHADRYGTYLDQLTAREYDRVIQGAMFMTEEQGGSDVGATETVAKPAPTGTEGSAIGEDGVSRVYELTGEKWFCSNIDAQATLALARRPGAPAGTEGLSLFLVTHELPSGEPNDQRYRRLKDKLGTVSVPTGEVEFDGTRGYLVGEPERGFKYMTTMLNWERVTNAVGAAGLIGRLFLESAIQAATREAFGQPIQEFPLMQRDLVEMALDHESSLAVAMAASFWLDRYERDHGDDEAFRLMRVLVPVAKHGTTRTAVETASYAMEIQGGNGYVRDFVTHRLYRDVQALPIWEGTANILSLDVVRAMETASAHEALLPHLSGQLDGISHGYLVPLREVVQASFEDLQDALGRLAAEPAETVQYAAKDVTEHIYDLLAATLLLERAQDDLKAADDARKAVLADLFVGRTFEAAGRGRVRIDDQPAIRYFDPIVRYGRIDPAELPDTPFSA